MTDDFETMPARDLATLSDCKLIGAYQLSTGEPGNTMADALAVEIDRRNLDLYLAVCSCFVLVGWNGESTMTITPERIASLLEEAPVGAIARLTLLSTAARHEAALTVAKHLCRGLTSEDRDQLRLPL